MTAVKIEKNAQLYDGAMEKLATEIAALKTELAKLAEQQTRAPWLVRLLENWLTIGTVKESEWLQFKLALNERELAAKQHQQRNSGIA